MTTIRTSAADVNRLSCSNNIWGYDEGSDHAQTLDHIPEPLDLLPPNPQAFSAILKICDNSHDIWLGQRGLIQIAQGKENSVDFNNRVANCTIAAEFGFGGGVGDQVITVKGGCHDCRFSGVIHSTGRNGDVVIDAWSDQCHDLCSNIDLSGLTRADNQPVCVILGRFGSKANLPRGAKVLFWKSLGYKLYWLGKLAAVKMGLFK